MIYIPKERCKKHGSPLIWLNGVSNLPKLPCPECWYETNGWMPTKIYFGDSELSTKIEFNLCLCKWYDLGVDGLGLGWVRDPVNPNHEKIWKEFIKIIEL